jgi:1,4-dihydroxy-2-naphthoyl-CoA synthase
MAGLRGLQGRTTLITGAASAIGRAVAFRLGAESIRGTDTLAFQGLALYYGTEESQEGVKALREKRAPDFRRSA